MTGLNNDPVNEFLDYFSRFGSQPTPPGPQGEPGPPGEVTTQQN